MRPSHAARELGLNRSTVTRYLDQYAELKDSDGLVDLDELRRHRADNPTVAESAKRADLASPAPKPGPKNGRKDTKARLDEIKLEREERSLAIENGEYVEVAAVADPLNEAAMRVRDTLLSPDYSLGERLAAETDPLRALAMVKDWNRQAVASLAQVFEELAKARAAQAGAPENGDA